MTADSAVFTFDVNPFLGAVKQMSDSLTNFTAKAKQLGEAIASGITLPFKKAADAAKNLSKGMFDAVATSLPSIKSGLSGAVNGASASAKKVGQAITDGINAGVKAGIASIGKIFVAFNAAKNIFSKQMPEVGQAFSIASDIALKNFFYPIRQLILPLLNSMLKWVTNHRALFVQWGAAVANIFRTVILVAKQLWDIFKRVIDAIGNSLQKALGTHFRSFDEFLNMLSFKISAIIIWMGMVCKSLDGDFTKAFDWIVSQGEKVVTWVVKFATELGKAALDTGTFYNAFRLLKDIIEQGIDVTGGVLESLTQIGLGLLMPNQSGDNVATILASMTKTVKALGPAIRNAIAEFTKGFTASSSEIATPVRTIVDNITRIVESFDTEEAHRTFNALGTMIGTAFMGAAEIVEGVANAFASLVDNLFRKNENGHSLGTIMDTLAAAFTSLKGVVVTITSNFFEGFAAALKGIATPIDNVLTPIKELFGLLDDKGGLGKAFKTLGAILGGVFLAVISAVATELDAMATTLLTIVTVITGGINKETIAAVAKNWADFGSRAKQNAGVVGAAFSLVPAIFLEPDDPEVQAQLKAANEVLANTTTVHDAIITKTGQVIKTDPNDTIIAAKQIIGGGGNVKGGNTISITFGPTYITVPEGDAEKAGRDFGQSTAQTIADILSREMLLEGY
jgi:hypothetical protein